MPLREGQVVEGWVVGRGLPATSSVLRHQATAPDGTACELWEPRPSLAILPGAREAFRDAAQPEPGDPAVLPRTPLPTAEGVFQVAPRVLGTWEDSPPRLEPAEVPALVRWLGPAVLAQTHQLRGTLSPAELVLDRDGVPRLAPSGLPRPPSLFGSSRFTAPEVRAGGEPRPESALYGLGCLLYRSLTGTWPPESPSGERPPPPLPPSRLHPGVPPEVDALLLGLLDPRPEHRLRALHALGPRQGEPPRLQPEASPEDAASSLPGLLAPPVRRIDGPHLCLVDPRGLPEAALEEVAARAAIDVSALRRAAKRRQEVVVAGFRSPEEAEALAERLSDQGIPARTSEGARSRRGKLYTLAFLLLLAALFFEGNWALGLAAAGAISLGAGLLQRPRPLLRGPAPRYHPEPRVSELQRRLAALRALLAELPLPEAMAADLRDDLHALDQQLERLGDARLQETRRLAGLDSPRLKRELQRFPQDSQGALRLRDTLGELDATRDRIAAIDQELADTGVLLRELASTLAGLSRLDEPGDGELQRIRLRLSAARETAAELDHRLRVARASRARTPT